MAAAPVPKEFTADRNLDDVLLLYSIFNIEDKLRKTLI